MNNSEQPASPIFNSDGECNQFDRGLTKRERFAMAAMQGLVCATDQNGKWFHEAGDVAYTAVQYADALLAELAKEKSE